MRKHWYRAGILGLVAVGVVYGTTHAVHAHQDHSAWLNSTASAASVGTNETNRTAGSTPMLGRGGQDNESKSPSTQTGPSTTGSSAAPAGTSAPPKSASSQDGTAHSTSTSTAEAASEGTVTTPASENHAGGAPVPPKSLGTFTILVTKNHGASSVATEKVPIVPGDSLMDYMHKYFTITTAYGDAYITSINGIQSQWTGVPIAQRHPVDWFLYVNQQEAPVGAADIVPRAGDIDDWDYHSWDPSTGRG